MVNTAESKQHQSRHFGFKHKALARESTSLIGKGPKRTLTKKTLVVPSKHISRRDQFYGLQPRNVQQLRSVKKAATSKAGEEKDLRREEESSTISSSKKIDNIMHPEQVQVSEAVEVLVEEKHVLKPQEVIEDDIDVEEVDSGDLNSGANGGSKEELNGNGVHHKDNGHPLEIAAESAVEKEQLDVNPANGADLKSVTRVRSSRRNSTSSRSSSVSSAPSLKQHTPMALQMEVSMDEEERDHMEPLIIEGNAEDLEVSMSASHDDADDGATTDSEAILEAVHDPYEFDEEMETEMLSKKAKSKSSRGFKSIKSPSKSKSEGKVNKLKTPRTKSLKLKTSKPSPRLSDKFFEEMDAENSDTNSLSKDDTESEDLNTKPLKSPSKRSKTSPSKQDLIDEGEVDDKGSESEHVPRRSARSRQTPQKYNSSLYMDSVWENQLVGEDRMNNSDAYGASSIRSVKGRRSLRKSRNISALNTSLHNESSPWDNDFKVLTPCGGGLSVHHETVGDTVESTTPLKRKATEDDDNEEYNERGQKKMCVENTDLDNSTASQTSSFFSVITSPIVMLRNKFRGSSVSSSTPIKANIVSPPVDPVDPINPVDPLESEAPSGTGVEDGEDVGPVAEEVAPVHIPVETAAVEKAEEARSWCAIM